MRLYALVSLIGLYLFAAQTVPAQTAQASTPRNPFEAVPELPSESPPPPKIPGQTIEAIEFRGAIHLQPSALRAIIVSGVGDAYDAETLRRDSRALYKTGRFSDIVWETELGAAGVIVRFVVVERPLIQSIEYQGDYTVTVPEILERFKQRKIKLRVESLYDEDELGRAAATVQELLAQRGQQNITVTASAEQIGPPLTVKIVFRVQKKQ